MKKILFLLLFTVSIYGQTLQNPTYGTVTEKNNATDSTPAYFTTSQVDGVHKKTPAANVVMKTDSIPATSVTVSPIGSIASTNAQSALQELDSETVKLTETQTISGQLSLSNSLNLTNVGKPATLLTVAINGAAGNLTGEYLYGVSYYTADGKDTGVPDVTSVLTLSAGRVDISNIPISSNPLVVGRRIYRTAPSLGDYRAMKLVVQIADNTTTTYQDNIADGSLGAYPQWYNTTGGELKLGGNRVFSIDGQSFAIGRNVSLSNTGYANHIVGNYAGYSLTYGYRNTLNSLYAGYSLTSGYENTATGVHSINYNTTGHANTAYGFASLFKNTTGSDNVAIGNNAISENLTGSRNVALGNYAGFWELGSDAFYVHNSKQTNTANDKSKSMLYGVFDPNTSIQNLRVNGKFGIGGAPDSYYDLKVSGSSGRGIATGWITSGGSYLENADLYMPGGGLFRYDVAGTKTTAFRYDSSGYFYFTKVPVTSAGTYDFLTRNTSTGVIEKINTDIALTGTPTAPTATAGTNTTQIATTAFVQAASTSNIAQTITNGVTTSAPSQDAVFDALALKANLNGGTFNGNVETFNASFITNQNYRLNSLGSGLTTTVGTGFSFTTGSGTGWVSNAPITATQYNISALNTAPTSATDTGVLGEVRITATYIYVCTATNTWVRTALATW